MDDATHLGRPAPRMGFAGNCLTRDGEHRTAETLALSLAHPGARLYLQSGGLWLCPGGTPAAPDPAFDRRGAARLGLDEASCILLGHDRDGAPVLAGEVAPSDTADAAVAAIPAFELRALGLADMLDPDVEGQLAQAAHLLTWHRRNRFCGKCGTPSLSEAAGGRRKCPACGDLRFPRTDPVTIMLVHDGAGSCVLGRQPRFPERMWSCLAGFVEAGETIEDAVRRETLEEAGLVVGPVRYHASQPWPFPGSLMIGCIALASNREIAFDTAELEACRWFGRDEVRAMLEGTHPDGLEAPKPFAIAHHLVRAFVAGETD